jgi:hypothetical protein
MKYIMCSRVFPKGHPKVGQPTFFIESIFNSLYPGIGLDNIADPIREMVNDFALMANVHSKHHTIRAGSRFKPGDMVSLRVWAGRPYCSKQIEFAQVEVKKVWGIEINVIQTSPVMRIENKPLTYDAGKELAANDGLLLTDFISWFAIHPKKKEQTFTGQIICWSDKIEYSKTSTLTEKMK